MRHAIAILLLLSAAAAAAGELTIDRIFSGGSLNGPTPDHLRISPDGSRVTFLRAKADDQDTFDLWEYNVRAGATRLLVDSRRLSGDAPLSDAEKARRERARIANRHGIVDYSWSPDGQRLLFPLAGKLYLYDLSAGNPASALRELATGGEALDPQVSPKGHYVSFLRGQNLCVIDLRDGVARELTRDGGGTVHNGEAEFVAQEEMHRFHGYWWAPDESAIAFERFDEAGVALVRRFEVYADRSEVVEQRYPAAGAANVQVRLGLVAATGGQARWIDLGSDPDIYLARVDWVPDSRRLSYQRMPRSQQRLDLQLVDVATLQQRTLLRETSDTWVDLNDDLRFLKQRSAFVWGSDRSGYHHLYLYSLDGTLQRALSAGDWNVDGLLALDERAGLAYVESNRDFVPDRQLYALRLDGSTAQAPRRISAGDGSHGSEFARAANLYVDTWSNPQTPPQVSVRSPDGKRLAWIEENPLDAQHPYAPYRDALIAPQFGTLKAADGRTDLYYRLYRPANFHPAQRYPVFMTYYGGPHGQVVTRIWGDHFGEYMAQHGYVVFALDNRGMARRGRAFSDALFRRLGRAEVDDQLAGVHWLKQQAYVDPNRIGVFGWSYGGYMTAMLLAKASNEFAAGVAVAPVVDWTLYDTFYTERYLGRPQDNAGAYALSGVLHWLDGLKAPLLLIHGMADDNVLFANSTQLMSALQQRGTQFDLMTYPGGKHGLSTPEMRKHAYHTIVDFFDARVKGEKVENTAK